MKLHLGCGKRQMPGFVHVDLAAYEHVDFQRDVRDLSCFGDAAANLIYACHVLEYFDLREAYQVLVEWRRVLEPNGVLRLAVPDFDALLQVYVMSKSLPAILGPLYGRMIPAGGDSAVYHKTVYNFEMLSALLVSVGFRGVRKWDWRMTEHSHIDDCSQAYWPHMDKEKGILISLNVEARKVE